MMILYITLLVGLSLRIILLAIEFKVEQITLIEFVLSLIVTFSVMLILSLLYLSSEISQLSIYKSNVLRTLCGLTGFALLLNDALTFKRNNCFKLKYDVP